MTIATTTRRVTYAGADSTGPFTFTFRVSAASHLLVTKRDAEGDETTLALNADYTVTGVGDRAGGSITLEEELAEGETLVIERVVPLTQEVQFRTQSAFLPETHEDALDHLTAIDQQQQADLDRTPKLPRTADLDGVSLALPEPRALHVMHWNAAGTGLASTALSGLTGTAAGLESGTVTVADHGAVGDGETDDTDAIQAAILAAYTSGVRRVWIPPTASGYYLASTVYYLPGVEIIGARTLLVGPGSGILLDSGVVADGEAVTNAGDAAGASDRHQGTRLTGLVLRNDALGAASSGTLLRGHNVNELCAFTNLHLYVRGTVTALDLENCFYLALRDVFVRGQVAGGEDVAQIGVAMGPEANSVAIDGLAVTGCGIGIELRGGRGLRFANYALEQCGVGLSVAAQTEALSFDGGYVEANTVAGMQIGGGSVNVRVDDSYFYGNELGIDIAEATYVQIGANVRFDHAAGKDYIRTSEDSLAVRIDRGILNGHAGAPADPVADLDVGDGIVAVHFAETSWDVTAPTAYTEKVWKGGAIYTKTLTT